MLPSFSQRSVTRVQAKAKRCSLQRWTPSQGWCWAETAGRGHRGSQVPSAHGKGANALARLIQSRFCAWRHESHCYIATSLSLTHMLSSWMQTHRRRFQTQTQIRINLNDSERTDKAVKLLSCAPPPSESAHAPKANMPSLSEPGLPGLKSHKRADVTNST